MPFNVHTSNRLEALFEHLARRLREVPRSPFETETIAVQNQGMDRWLSLRFAGEFKVWAGCRYPFPGKLIYDIFRNAFPEIAEREPLGEPLLAWKIMEALPRLKEETSFMPVRRFLENDASGFKLYQLSKRLARLFDDYQIYRPEMVLDWDVQKRSAGTGTEAWQQRLWKEITKGMEGGHRAALQKRFLDRLKNATAPELRLPARITVFGISYLAPFHFTVLQALQEFTDVSMYFLNPSQDFWGDGMSGKERARIANQQRQSEEELLLGRNNPILSEMGHMGREFHAFVTDNCPQTVDHFEEPGCATLLQTLQTDILNNRLRSEKADEKPVQLRTDDNSIQIHDCHSPIRELEVLHDSLVRLLETHKNLQPRDILVMAPDIEVYAPFVRAVFDRKILTSQGAFTLPVSVADRPMGAGLAAAGLLSKLLKLDLSRFTLSEIVDILEAAPVRLRFGLSMADCALIRQWLTDTAVRWGRDAGHRKSVAGCTTEENSWKQAFERMFLGYAMPGRAEFGPADILTYPQIEGSSAPLLGKLHAFYEILCRAAVELPALRTVETWTLFTQGLLNSLMKEDRDAPAGLNALVSTLKSIRENAEKAGYAGEVSLPVFRALLEEHFTGSFGGGGFLKGGITFCALQPMRSVPFEVIALLGMNNGEFPRRSEPAKFNLMAAARKPGDKDIAHEDRYLFLETLLSARKALIVSFTGRSIKDNKEKLPSSCVSGLIDTLKAMIVQKPGTEENVKKQDFYTEHPLHPFSRNYFNSESKLFSYSADMCDVASRIGTTEQPEPFVKNDFVPAGESWKSIDIDTLARFFVNPAKHFFTRVMNLHFPEPEEELQEKELFKLQGLESYTINDRALSAALDSMGRVPESLFKRLKAEGVLPHGTGGKLEFNEIVEDTEALVGQTKTELQCETLEFVMQKIEVTLNGYSLTGHVRRFKNGGVVGLRPAKIKDKDRMNCWIRHLALCAQEGPLVSVIIAPDSKPVRYRALSQEEAGGILAGLLEKYATGQLRPLPFYLASAFKYFRKPGSPVSEMAARAAFYKVKQHKNDFVKGDIDDPYIQTAVRHLENSRPMDPVGNPEFQQNVLDILGALYGCEIPAPSSPHKEKDKRSPAKKGGKTK